MRLAITPVRPLAAAITLLAVFAAGCNGSSSIAPPIGGGATPTPTPSPAPLPAAATATIPVGGAPASASLGPVTGGYSSAITVPAGSTSAVLTLTLAATQPAGTPAVQTIKHRPQTIGSTGIATVAFVTIASSATVTFGTTPTFTFTVPGGAAILGQVSYLALYDPSATPQPGWTTFAGPGTVSGNTITFTGSGGNQQLKSGVTYDIVLFTTTSALPTPSPNPTATAAPTPTPVPTATPVPSAQHLYMFPGMGSSIVAEYALPLTPNSTPIVSVPVPAMASDSELGPGLAVNAKHVIYTDVSHDAYYVFDQPLSASSKPSAIFCDGFCGNDHPNSPSIMTLALSPFDFLAGTDSGGPIASQFVRFFNGPFESTKGSTPPLLALPSSGSGLAYDAAGNLYAGGGSTPNAGDLEVYGGNIQLAHIKMPMFVTSVAVNANEVAVSGRLQSSCLGVLIYSLPLTSSSTPFATITNGIGNACGGYVALDAAGNLYVNGTTAGLSVYGAPLSNSSSPSFSLPENYATQIVIGP
jgi:hypothetical protein